MQARAEQQRDRTAASLAKKQEHTKATMVRAEVEAKAAERRADALQLDSFNAHCKEARVQACKIWLSCIEELRNSTHFEVDERNGVPHMTGSALTCCFLRHSKGLLSWLMLLSIMHVCSLVDLGIDLSMQFIDLGIILSVPLK